MTWGNESITDEGQAQIAAEALFEGDQNPLPPIAPRKVIALTRERFLSRGKPKTMVIEMLAWQEEGEPVPLARVRAMTGGEQDQLSQLSTTTYDPETKKMILSNEPVRARVITWCLLDYLTEQALLGLEDVFIVNAMGNDEIARIYSYISNLSSIKQEEADKIEKAFPKTPAANSSTI